MRQKISSGHYTKNRQEICSGTNREFKYDLSVIVPFYKTQEYASRCIESILNQRTRYSLEIILVDDGSPDNCGAICDEYENRDERISVIHKKNGGLSDARNAGLLFSSGKYVMFVDSDDFLEDNAIETLLKNAFKYEADIVDGSYLTVSSNGKIKENIHKDEVLEKGENMFGYPWGKVYKACLFSDICFPVGYWFEDTIIPALIFPSSKRTVNISDVVYVYFINKQGITSQAKTSPKSIDTYYIYEELFRIKDDVCFDYLKTWNKSIIWQLSKYVYYRCANIGKKI